MALGRGWVGRIPNIETQGGPGSFEGGAGAQLFVECAARQYLGGELLVSSAAGARGRLWDARLLARVPQRLPDHGMAWVPQCLCCCMIRSWQWQCHALESNDLPFTHVGSLRVAEVRRELIRQTRTKPNV